MQHLLTMSTVPISKRASCTHGTARCSDSSRGPGIIRPAGPRAGPRLNPGLVTVRARASATMTNRVCLLGLGHAQVEAGASPAPTGHPAIDPVLSAWESDRSRPISP